MSIESSRLVIELKRPRYRLEDLLAQCDAGAEHSAEDQQWLDGPPVGRELL